MRLKVLAVVMVLCCGGGYFAPATRAEFQNQAGLDSQAALEAILIASEQAANQATVANETLNATAAGLMVALGAMFGAYIIREVLW
jgi:hypothetical protein